MEVNREEIPQEKWDEMKQIARDYLCAECGGELTIHTNPEKATLEASCINREHHGWVERKTFQQSYRRGEIVPVTEMTRDIMPRDELGRAMNLLALRYPDAIIDQATAALFIVDCARLNLDPLISPAEAVPVPFKGAKKKTVQMVITVDGWLSMATRGCPERWAGAPTIERIVDKDLAESLCSDPDAWLYKVTGRTKDMESGQTSSAYGWYTHSEWNRIKNTTLPAATQPGNQAATRGIKKWVRQNFPECRKNMIDITAEWLKQAEGIKAAEEYIDAEYKFIAEPTEEGEANIPWIAGFFEGEGSISISKGITEGRATPEYSLKVQAANTKRDTLEKIQKRFGGRVSPKTPIEGHKPCYEWALHSRNAVSFLRQIFPYLTSKLEQTKLAIEFQNHIDTFNYHGGPIPPDEVNKREQYYLRMKQLNLRGEPLISQPEGGDKDGGPQAPEKETAKNKVSEPSLSPPKEEENSQKIRVSAAEEGTFTIDLDWLQESLKVLKWADSTAKTWLASKYKVSPTGTLVDVINRLTREQAEGFTKEIQERTAKKQLELLE